MRWWPEPVDLIPVTHGYRDAPIDARLDLGGITWVRDIHVWRPARTFECRAHVMFGGDRDPVTYWCQLGDSHAGSHRCIVQSADAPSGYDVLWWWKWGNDRTNKRLAAAEWGEAA